VNTRTATTQRNDALRLRRERIELRVAHLLPALTNATAHGLQTELARHAQPGAQLLQEANQRLLRVRRVLGLFETGAYREALTHLQMALRADLDQGLLKDDTIARLTDLIEQADLALQALQPAPSPAPAIPARSAVATPVPARPTPRPAAASPVSTTVPVTPVDTGTDVLLYAATGIPTSGRTLLLDVLDIGRPDAPVDASPDSPSPADPGVAAWDAPVTDPAPQEGGSFGGGDYQTGGSFGGDSADTTLPSFNDSVSAATDASGGYYS
jgi:hypothetical protein